MGIFAGLDAEKYDRKYSDRYLFRRISHYFRPYVKRLSLVIFLIIAISLLYALLPLTVSRGVDLIQADQNLAVKLLIPGAVILIGFLGWSANWGLRRLLTRTIADVLITLASDAFQGGIFTRSFFL